ncbi:MAG: toxin [Candidatus Doudnabacteria bacterium RIFCSPLOWO2_02_FULL_49_13]|uniref:Toxin n=1 Tax=Candidatus Doudnabacteria bacterium RIFCSPHIGHO2_12_FULL_48_16 TaxID=1817838 RepID=A0A1F5PK28_9BACT|nr:MAG: toxin [Candidatus Doudnabacteria bacterium RIFCSPHIGHO2_02_FULL_49_24]OGE90298.1 MAG: toxin [Candidatus Doudnabacteria bacterium RIFCSPHIGHO2_12_FULL_48_16]OGF02354.1 MAG: toxin [Candidatus Doudnabacteria bacterium RIFCSPLOWO2_02_FULL_49_13]OGF03508.1 MAG: toxin [Candidatus Doudnabacteria bacterium RIFCSPLOWO2_12_FULL_49_8]
MKYFDWSVDKNIQLIDSRGIGFEYIIIALNEGRLLDILEHPNSKKYLNQKIFVVEINHYAYLVPFVEDDKKIFLKTIIPSRKATKKYLINK